MNQRYGAWAQLLALFRLIHDGGSHAGFRIPPRKGYLFDPERYPVLEGRPVAGSTPEEDWNIPRVSDGVLFRVLSNLLILDGERLHASALLIIQPFAFALGQLCKLMFLVYQLFDVMQDFAVVHSFLLRYIHSYGSRYCPSISRMGCSCSESMV